MTTHELLELAGLDALGLLDERERESFDRGFAAAPPALQAQIRREQARFARADGTLPEVDAPVSLRARVIAAVRDAVQAMAGSHERSFTLMPSRGVARVWRAAAIGCATAAIVFGFTTLQMRSQFEAVNERIAANFQSDQWIRELGPRFEQMLFDPSTRFVKFTGDSAGEAAAVQGKAVMLIDPESGRALFHCRDLPPTTGEFSLAVVDEQGNIVGSALLKFRPVTDKVNEQIPGVKVQAGQRLAIFCTQDGGKTSTVLRSSL
ncbi:MAG: hypothetical protein H7Y88_00735 [Phycisphaerales bacterium]|nr:hypothetical protein [Phycisphaerales bacterium]